MSTNLEQQLIRLAELLDESAPTITGDEIVSAAEHAGGSPTITLRAHRSQQRSSRVAAFAAAAVLVVGLTGLIGVTVWRSDGPESVSDRPDDSPPRRPPAGIRRLLLPDHSDAGAESRRAGPKHSQARRSSTR